ncbi:MAG TPA: YetF domain-containing protein [Thermohalobaculum sp.]|nr:YetF domain-containing protein [Thermohalobaculum sp.]
MAEDWITGSAETVVWVLLSLVLLYLVILVCIRLIGLRSLSKMSSTDFITTVAVGSLLGGALAAPTPSVVQAAAGLAGLFAVMLGAAWVRRHVPGATRLMDNRPLYLMDGPRVLDENLERANVTLDELHGKLRQAGVWNYQQVIAVVFECTGDVSVLARGGEDLAPDPAIFAGIAGASGRPARRGKRGGS